jgi:hypothetical protein
MFCCLSAALRFLHTDTHATTTTELKPLADKETEAERDLKAP